MEQVVPPPSDRLYTEAEYIAFEEASTRDKHEFRHGRIIAMPGGTLEHGQIPVNLGGELRQQLKPTPCLVLSSDVRVRVSATGHHCYPDLSVVCADPVYHAPDRRNVLVNPQVVIEVLSPSSIAADLGDKLDDYLGIESVRDYVVLAQDRPWARTFSRGPGGPWGIRPIVERLEATLWFPSLDVGVPMAEVYAKVRFPSAAAEEPPSQA